MKLVSVQSRGNRLVRVMKMGSRAFGSYYVVWGKDYNYSPEWGATVSGCPVSAPKTKPAALKAAAEWLERAEI